jgi:DNA-binding beta-propeller fold protein YncE
VFKLTIAATVLVASALASSGAAQLPDATVKVWHIADVIGFNPDECVEDIGGLTDQVDSPLDSDGDGLPDQLTIVTAIENTFNFGGPCGVIYWNPVTNFFRDFGFSSGFQSGIDLNTDAPPLTDGTHTFGPGDVWLAKSGNELWVHIAGTGAAFAGDMGTFIVYGTSSTFGTIVDQGTGLVWACEQFLGAVSRLNPATAVLERWSVGGQTFYVALDGAGNAYATVDSGPGGDQIVRIEPATNTLSRWIIPGGGLSSAGFETPNGIDIDADGKVWFVESESNEIGRLDPVTNEICEYASASVSDPQLVATTGLTPATRQVFFTEAVGNSGSVLTEIEADSVGAGACVIVAPVVSVLAPTIVTVSKTALLKPSREFVITPAVFIVPGTSDFVPSGDVVCDTPAMEEIPAILRFAPMPTAPGGFPPNNPAGITGVFPENTIHGSYFLSSQMFRVESCAILAEPPPPPGLPHFTTPCDTTTEEDNASDIKFDLSVGVPFSYTVSAFDEDEADVVTITAVGTPAGATHTPALPVMGNPASSVFDWTPGNGDVGTFCITYTASDGDPETLDATCKVTLNVAECHLIVAGGAGSDGFTVGGYTWPTHLEGIRTSYPVLVDSMPSFPIPLSTGSAFKARQLMDHFTVQVVMFNPEVFPENAEQWTNALEVWVWGDGRVTTRRFGQRDGMDLWLDTFTDPSGQRFYRFPFSIDGL